ncbi:hypothetical protein FACS1894199_15100 [Bacteroidia bacterium]|nr:hypothetical protein FACS1894199_15100 [Bacteroidia bacterium]
MTVKEQQEQSKMEPYAEAMRFMKNAEETLQKTRKDDGYYLDRKYVRRACGIAYKGVLVALSAWLQLKGVSVPKRKRETIECCMDANVARLDERLAMEWNTVCSILLRSGYYEGLQDERIISSSFEDAYDIIARIKPDVPEEELQQYIEEHTKKKSTLWGQLSSFMLF